MDRINKIMSDPIESLLMNVSTYTHSTQRLRGNMRSNTKNQGRAQTAAAGKKRGNAVNMTQAYIS